VLYYHQVSIACLESPQITIRRTVSFRDTVRDWYTATLQANARRVGATQERIGLRCSSREKACNMKGAARSLHGSELGPRSVCYKPPMAGCCSGMSLARDVAGDADKAARVFQNQEARLVGATASRRLDVGVIYRTSPFIVGSVLCFICRQCSGFGGGKESLIRVSIVPSLNSSPAEIFSDRSHIPVRVESNRVS